MIFLIIFLVICLQVFLTAKKISPFLSLLIVAILTGICLGMPFQEIITSIEKGVGNTLGGLTLIICLGAILGKILEESGAAEQISITLIQGFGLKNVQWAILLTGFLVGIPLYYNAGFIIIVPLVFMLVHKTKLPILYLALPMAAALSSTHCFLPPHPGPVVLVNAFNADMGLVLLYGIVLAIPSVIIAGPVFSRFLLKKQIKKIENAALIVDSEKILPSAWQSFLVALLPVILMAIKVAAEYFLADSYTKNLMIFVGNPTIALLISVIVGFYLFGVKTNISMSIQMNWLKDAIFSISVILMIIAAGGVFKQILQDSGTAQYIAKFSQTLTLPPLVFAWLVTAFIRVMVGSATVAGLTAAGIVAPLIASSQVSPELMVLAVGAGSVFGSHINDTGFWMFKEYFKLSLKETFLSWTAMETIISVVGLIGVLILDIWM